MCPLSLIAQIFFLSSNVQASVFSEVIARVESRFNHFCTVIHDPDARVAAICAIDKEIDEQLKAVDATKQFLHSQRACLKAFAPISLLPPEVLARVFHFLVFEDPGLFRRTESGLDQSHTRLPVLASSRTRRFVIMGHNLGHLGKDRVDLRDVSSFEECAVGH